MFREGLGNIKHPSCLLQKTHSLMEQIQSGRNGFSSLSFISLFDKKLLNAIPSKPFSPYVIALYMLPSRHVGRTCFAGMALLIFVLFYEEIERSFSEHYLVCFSARSNSARSVEHDKICYRVFFVSV